MRYSLRGIVDHHGQQISEYPIAPLQDHIADCCAHILSERALYAIFESDGAAIDFETRGVRHPVAGGMGTATSGVAQVILELLTTAATGESQPARVQIPNRSSIRLDALRLIEDFAVPFETEIFQGFEDAIRGARDLARLVQILDPKQPAPAVSTGIQEARSGRI